MSSSAFGPIQSRVAGVTFTIEHDGTTLFVNGEPSDATVQKLGEYAYLYMENGKPQRVYLEFNDDGSIVGTADSHRLPVEIKTSTDLLLESFGMDAEEGGADREIRAPMPGLVLRLLVAAGDTVEAGQSVAVLEAMKMENELKAPAAGTIAAVHTEEGAAVGKNDLLIELGE